LSSRRSDDLESWVSEGFSGAGPARAQVGLLDAVDDQLALDRRGSARRVEAIAGGGEPLCQVELVHVRCPR